MSDDRTEFEQLLYDQLLPDFCSESARGFEPSLFQKASIKISEQDALYFMRALNAGLIEHQGFGRYRAPCSGATEQLFWEGRKTVQPRRLTLWLEPLLIIGGLARLHFDYGWPKNLIGTQSRDGAIDLMAFVPGSQNEYIACEVKKSQKEVRQLLDYMGRFTANPETKVPSKSDPAHNAFKKVLALRRRRPPIFWALGPDGEGQIFNVQYDIGEVVQLQPTCHAALSFDSAIRNQQDFTERQDMNVHNI